MIASISPSSTASGRCPQPPGLMARPANMLNERGWS
jgi:hypothetical protein